MKTAEMKAPARPSSQIIMYGYEDANLYITFKNATYKYKEVPQDVFDKFENSESLGKFLISDIKSKYPFEKVELEITEKATVIIPPILEEKPIEITDNLFDNE